MDAALDDLVDTLGEPAETEEDNTVYTGPEISVRDFDLCKDSYLLGRKASKFMAMRHRRLPDVLLHGEK